MNIPSWLVTCNTTCNMHTRLECLNDHSFRVHYPTRNHQKPPKKKALFFGSQNLAAILRVKRIPPLNIGQRGFFSIYVQHKKVAGIFPRQVGSAIFDLCFFFPVFFWSHRWFEDVFFSDFGRFFRWRSFFSDVLTSGGLSLKLLSLVTSLLPVASCTVTRPLPAATFTGSEGNTKTAWPWYSGFCFRCNHTCRWEKKVPPQRVEKFWRAQGTASNAFLVKGR